MSSWIPLDALRQQVECALCGHEYNATCQIVEGDWHFRRSGVLGAEKNAQGAIAVALTLQQLDMNLRGALSKSVHSPSLDLEPMDATGLPTCEVDFVWIIPCEYPRKTAVILGECKDQGAIDDNDIDTLQRVADALPSKNFETFVLLAKLCQFTPQEIESARALNDTDRLRAILMTARELEAYHIDEHTPGALARATAKKYFQEQAVGPV